jgi:hypothetical protein
MEMRGIVEENIRELKGTYCPFRVLRVSGFTLVMCDFTQCNRSQCNDCTQAYISVDASTKRGRRAKEPIRIAAGCFYVPKLQEHSIERHPPKQVV